MEADSPVAIGADAAPAGWAVVSLLGDADTDSGVGETRLHLVTDIDELVGLRDGSNAPIAIDIPIGLPETVRYRSCDELACDLLGDRREVVFPPPARYMLEAAGDYPAIRQLVAAEQKRNPAARGYSAQAAGIAKKVREVDTWVREHRESEAWLFECIPRSASTR